MAAMSRAELSGISVNKTKATSSEGHLKAQYEDVCRERDGLQQSLVVLERDNEELRKSVYELSYMLSMQGNSSQATFSLGGMNGASAASPDGARGVAMRTSFDPMLGPGGTALEPFGLMNDGGIGGGGVQRVLVPEAKLVGHTGAVYVACYSPSDNGLVASAGFDRTLRLWEATYPYSQVGCLTGHRQLIADLCWAVDGRSLLSASFDQTVACGDTETGQRTRVTRQE
ncbi:unnamed protein product, partial [Discosporangium mesarthrocarpum]